jgi:hypothetical protein
MSNAVWVVSQDLGHEGFHVLAVFTSRARMFGAIDRVFDETEILTDSAGKPYYAHCWLKTNYYPLALERYNLDQWSERLV